jgi:hypothetical protein
MVNLEVLKSYSYLGGQTLGNGTMLIGRAPHIAPSAWLHCIHNPLNDKAIKGLEEILKCSIPGSYKSFLKISNGLKVFNTTFCLYGLRQNYARDVVSVWQPFDIVNPNDREKPSNAQKNMFFIGGYDWDGSLIYIDRNDDKVYMCESYDARPVFEWPTFEIMIESELKRLAALFDRNGKEYDENRSTLPV